MGGRRTPGVVNLCCRGLLAQRKFFMHAHKESRIMRERCSASMVGEHASELWPRALDFLSRKIEFRGGLHRQRVRMKSSHCVTWGNVARCFDRRAAFLFSQPAGSGGCQLMTPSPVEWWLNSGG